MTNETPPQMAQPHACEIEDARRNLQSLEDSYLRRWGWTQTCHTPGSYWMWSRSFGDYNSRWDEWNAKVTATGRGSPHKPYPPMTLPRDEALRITLKCLDERPEDGECDD